jgi:outer membrane protein TolC
MGTSLNLLIDKLNTMPGPKIPHVSDKFPLSDKERVVWDFTLTQPIFTGFALISKKKIAELGVDVARYEKEVVNLELARQVRLAYFNVLLSKRGVEIAEDEVKQLEAHVKDAERFYEQGVVAHNDVLKSKVALASARQKKEKAEADLRIAIATLNILLTRDPNESTAVEDLEPETKEPQEISSLWEVALKQRPEILLLKTSLEQAGLAVRIARSSYYPQVFLVAQYERVGDDFSASNNDYGNDHNSSITLMAKWNLFEWGKTQNEVRKALHAKAGLEERLKGLTDSILLEVKQAYESLKVSQANIETARAARLQARENFRITDLQYKEGVTTSTEVLDARAYLTQAENNYFRALYGYKMAEADLLKALGEK